MEVEVRREVVFSESAETVWRALTEPDRLAQWFANEVELVPEPGGRGVFRWEDGSVRYAVVEEVDPGRRFGFRWHEEGREEESTRVALVLDEVAGGTRVTVVESVESAPGAEPRASASGGLVGEWSWGVAVLAALPRLHRLAHA